MGKSLASILGKRVREARMRKGTSQHQLSMDAKLSGTYVSEIERGVRDAKLSTIEKIADALGVPPQSLLK